jgi:hypothetical protein
VASGPHHLFFETFLLTPHLAGYEPFDPQFGFLFNSYYEALGPRQPRPQRGLLTRPSQARVMAYRAHVDEAMTRLLGSDDRTFDDLLDLEHFPISVMRLSDRKML